MAQPARSVRLSSGQLLLMLRLLLHVPAGAASTPPIECRSEQQGGGCDAKMELGGWVYVDTHTQHCVDQDDRVLSKSCAECITQGHRWVATAECEHDARPSLPSLNNSKLFECSPETHGHAQFCQGGFWTQRNIHVQPFACEPIAPPGPPPPPPPPPSPPSPPGYPNPCDPSGDHVSDPNKCMELGRSTRVPCCWDSTPQIPPGRYACGTDSYHPPQLNDSWLEVCIAATCIGVLSLAVTIPQSKRRLQQLRDIDLPDDDNYQGVGGIFMFMCGLGDLVLSVLTCLQLLLWCNDLPGHEHFFECFLVTIAATWMATVYLICHTLGSIRATMTSLEPQASLLPESDSGRARASVTTAFMLTPQNRLMFTVVVLGSMSRFQSLAIMRLKLCGRKVLDYPMQDKHLFFLRNGGLYHHLVCDVPIALINIALIRSSGNLVSMDAPAACTGHSISYAWAMVGCKAALILWGAIGTGMQLLLTGHCDVGSQPAEPRRISSVNEPPNSHIGGLE